MNRLRHRYGRARRARGGGVAYPTQTIEHRNLGRGTEWRVVDYITNVRTPWLAPETRSSAEPAARLAVAKTDPNKLTPRHTRDGEWIVVHSLV